MSWPSCSLAATPDDFDPFAADAVPAAATVVPVQRTLAEVLGLEQGLCRGRGGSMHLWRSRAAAS